MPARRIVRRHGDRTITTDRVDVASVHRCRSHESFRARSTWLADLSRRFPTARDALEPSAHSGDTPLTSPRIRMTRHGTT